MTVQSQPGSEGAALLRITVEDTGIGIAPEIQARIFEKFTQADSSTTRFYGGTGLWAGDLQAAGGTDGGHIGLSSDIGRGSRSLSPQLPVAASSELPRLSTQQLAEQRLDDITVVLPRTTSSTAT